jgi:membrane fusion protein (multidrug efflux system)
MQDIVELPTQSESPETNEAQQPRGRKRLILGALLLLALGMGVPTFLHALAWESTDDAYIEGHVVSIAPKVADQVARVLVQDNQQVKAGDVLVELDGRDYRARQAQDQAELATAQAAARAAEVTLEMTRKTAGASLDQAVSNLQLAKTSVTSAEARASEARSGIEQAQAQVEAARAAVANAQATERAAQAEAERTKSDLARYDGLPAGAAAQQQVDAARAAARAAQANLEATHEGVSAAQSKLVLAQATERAARDAARSSLSQVGEAQAGVGEAAGRYRGADVTKEKIAAAESALASAQAEVQLKQAELDESILNVAYTKITAPVAGRVTRKSVEVGAYVQPGQPLLALVPEEIWVVANYKETQLKHMRPGQSVEIKVDTYPDHPFKGHVDSIQAGTGSRFSLLPPENATGNFVKVVQRLPVKIVFDETPDARRLLAPGMSVEPDVKVK